jgi:hypothetical protein
MRAQNQPIIEFRKSGLQTASSETDDDNRISYSRTCIFKRHVLATSEHQTYKTA